MTGKGAEDSRVEFKSRWPETDKVHRQLAGHANSARGEGIVWVIGINEKQRTYTNPEPPDLAAWWSQVSAKFDDKYPELTDLTVSLGDGNYVTALAFATDQAPYVIKSHNSGNAELEVPWRDGTRTRSAKRLELIRILTPATKVPETYPAYCEIHGTHGFNMEGEFSGLNGTLEFFMDQNINESTFLPWRTMSLDLTLDFEDGSRRNIPLSLPRYAQSPRPPVEGEGVTLRSDGAMARGPAVLNMSFYLTDQAAGLVNFGQVSAGSLNASLGVIGASRNIRFSVPLEASFVRSQQDFEAEPTDKLTLKSPHPEGRE